MFNKKIYIIACSIFLSAFFSPVTSYGKDGGEKYNNVKEKSSKVQKVAEDLYDLTLEENFERPHLGKYANKIAPFQKEQAKALKREKFKTELMRNGEVIVITIPAGNLYLPNDTALCDAASIYLRPFLKFLKTPDMYRLMLVMHTDNTGTDNYTFNLSKTRVEAVFDWFDNQKINTDFIIPYALGGSEPMLSNNSSVNRAENRRLEIYIVPGKAMIEMAKKGTITL
ncbi:MAG: OmpA family protein [Muribaculaceae bacterium]